MIGIVGIIILFVMVFGGYTLAGGHMDILLHALPFEMMIVGVASLGAFIIGNNISSIKHTALDVAKVFKGPKWNPQDYQDLLCLMYILIKLGRKSPADIEPHIESPLDSSIFGAYPKIQADRESVELICDTFRSASMNYDDPHQVEEVLDKRIEALLTQRYIPVMG